MLGQLVVPQAEGGGRLKLLNGVHRHHHCHNTGAVAVKNDGKLLGRKVDVVELKVDSKSALALAKNLVFHERSKHVRIKYHFIRDCLEDESIKASHIATTNQLADILTKSLWKSKF